MHEASRGRSARNLHRRVADFIPSAAFVWYSSNSVANLQGSVMVYSALHGEATAWYAAFRHDGGWRAGRVKGINAAQVDSYLAGMHSRDSSASWSIAESAPP